MTGSVFARLCDGLKLSIRWKIARHGGDAGCSSPLARWPVPTGYCDDGSRGNKHDDLTV